jgi:hypothetical protein
MESREKPCVVVQKQEGLGVRNMILLAKQAELQAPIEQLA